MSQCIPITGCLPVLEVPVIPKSMPARPPCRYKVSFSAEARMFPLFVQGRLSSQQFEGSVRVRSDTLTCPFILRTDGTHTLGAWKAQGYCLR